MKTKTKLRALTAAVSLALAGCSALEHLFENEKELPVAEVPAVVRSAAEQRLPGFVPTKAEVGQRNGTTVYELEGTVGQSKHELRIAADGTVLKVGDEDDD